MQQNTAKYLFLCFLAFLSLEGAHCSIAIAKDENKAEVSSINSILLQPDVQAAVVRIIDGDSLIVTIDTFPPIIGHHISVRVANCDTPELRDKNPHLRQQAKAAKQFTSNLIPTGSIVWLRNIQRDKYFRLLAQVEINGNDLATLLISNKLAVPYQGGSKANLFPTSH